MDDWFTVDRIDADTYAISEYRHWEETHCYLLRGAARSLLIDTGLGIGDIRREVDRLTDRPVIAAATHAHWDHIGGHRYFPDFCVHPAEEPWLTGHFPLPEAAVRRMVLDRCDPPDGFSIENYHIFQGTPTRLLRGGDVIDLGDRKVIALHTPGHSPGHLCFWEAERGYLFTGDLVYLGMLYADYPSTDPAAYLASLEKAAALPAKRIFPGHHALDVPPDLPARMRDAFREIKAAGKLRHGGGAFDYGSWSVRM